MNVQTKGSTGDDNSKPAKTGFISAPKWLTETVNGGSFPFVDLDTGTNGWSSPPPDGFSLRSADYFKNKQKMPGGSYLLSPAGIDWLRSSTKLDNNILARPDNRVAQALRKAQARGESLDSFIFAVNSQIPGKDGHYNLVFYFATEEPIQPGSVLHRFIEGDDLYRNKRFKLVTQLVKGPWVVKQAAAKFGSVHVGKAVKCSYYRGSNYLEIDVDVGSSVIMMSFCKLVLGYVTSLKTDIGFVLEAQTEDELPERLIGGVRVCGMDLSHAFVVDETEKPRRMMGSVIADHEEEEHQV